MFLNCINKNVYHRNYGFHILTPLFFNLKSFYGLLFYIYILYMTNFLRRKYLNNV